MAVNWRSTANLDIIKQRAELLRSIREFFFQHKVLEVETPLLCQHSATAVHIEPIMVSITGQVNNRRYLQTSPEYAMKRLLAFGIGDIFQITKAFRLEEIGRLHNLEFTILEWYRTGFDQDQLMNEVCNLFQMLLNQQENIATDQVQYAINKVSYREIFEKYVQIDPLAASVSQLQQFILHNLELSAAYKALIPNFSKQACQELLFNHYVEPNLAIPNQIWAIYNYPAEQAALAKIVPDQDGLLVAERFEVYVDGIELANGYHELLDPVQQQARFMQDQIDRQALGKLELEIDPFFMQALTYGMPCCSGVAVGIDRLLMVKVKAKDLREVISFPWDIA